MVHLDPNDPRKRVKRWHRPQWDFSPRYGIDGKKPGRLVKQKPIFINETAIARMDALKTVLSLQICSDETSLSRSAMILLFCDLFERGEIKFDLTWARAQLHRYPRRGRPRKYPVVPTTPKFTPDSKIYEGPHPEMP